MDVNSQIKLPDWKVKAPVDDTYAAVNTLGTLFGKELDQEREIDPSSMVYDSKGKLLSGKNYAGKEMTGRAMYDLGLATNSQAVDAKAAAISASNAIKQKKNAQDKRDRDMKYALEKYPELNKSYRSDNVINEAGRIMSNSTFGGSFTKDDKAKFKSAINNLFAEDPDIMKTLYELNLSGDLSDKEKGIWLANQLSNKGYQVASDTDYFGILNPGFNPARILLGITGADGGINTFRFK
jgi:hypothetical protein